MTSENNPAAGAEVPAYHVLGDQIRREDTLTPTGLTEVIVVPYQIDSGAAKGHQGAVRVAPADYTPEEVQREIEADAATHHLVADLGKPRV